MNKIALGLWLATWTNMAAAQVPEEYTVTDISGWTSSQLATLPWFDRYVPLAPAGASADFVANARNSAGVVAGTRAPASANSGAFVSGGSQTNSAAWGTYGWSYWSWDGRDWHYYSGNVNKSPAQDVNVFGQIIGYATMPGGGSSALDYETHGYLRDTATGEHLDLTPGAHRADFRSINDHGEIAGTWRTTNSFHAIRRLADGTEYNFTSPGGSVSPSVINNRGVISGMVVTYGSPAWVYHPFVSTGTNAMTQLPYPPQGSPENGSIYDINDHGMIVGQVYKGNGVEKQAVRWYPIDGGWDTDDLNELLADNPDDFLVDSAIAVNDAGHIIVKAHPDADVIVTHTLLLTPNVFPKPSVITLDTFDMTPTSAVVRAKINACNLSTTATFQYGTNTSYGSTDTVSGTFTGTVPALVTATLGNLAPHTTYHYRGSAVNSQGTTDGVDATFTTPYDYATWAAEQFGTNAANPAIAGENADPDFDGVINRIEYAMGGLATIADDPVAVSHAVDSDIFMLSFTRPTDRSGVSYVVEQATEMGGPWTDAAGVGVILNPDGTETVGMRSTSAVSLEPIQFMRLRISMQ